jgi:hypothetical protein
MNCKITTLGTYCFLMVFWTFMVVHYAKMKAPAQDREVASWFRPVKPLYDASFKL